MHNTKNRQEKMKLTLSTKGDWKFKRCTGKKTKSLKKNGHKNWQMMLNGTRKGEKLKNLVTEEKDSKTRLIIKIGDKVGPGKFID